MSTAFTPNPYHDEMRDVVRQFCAEQVSEQVVRKIMESDTGHDPALWERLGSELGILGLNVPEVYGGSEQGLYAQALVVEELGAALVPGPVIGTLGLAIPALCTASNEEVRGAYLPALTAGTMTAAFAVPDRGGQFAPEAIGITARAEQNGWRLSGAMAHVVDAPFADLVIVAANGPDGAGLWIVERDTSGVAIEPMTVMDETRRRGIVTLEDAEAVLLSGADETPAICASAFLAAGALIAAEQAGGAGRVLDNTVDYVTNRIQFGRPIGSFQAIKHRCADLLVAVEHARSVARHAAWSIEEKDSAADLNVAVARSICSESYYDVAAASIQLHGGIGFTWEHSAHLYLKRAVTDASLLGSAEEQRRIIADRVF